MSIRVCWLLLIVWWAVLVSPACATTTNRLVWHGDRVDADVRGWELVSLLEHIAAQTHWHIFLEPGGCHQASAKFNALPVGEALRSLLGDYNFALIPQQNEPSRLFVFRTARDRATQRITAKDDRGGEDLARRVPNQLIVRFKSGAEAERWAQLLGAKIIGRITNLNAYLLEFDDEAAANLARDQLAGNSNVESIDYNYYVERPEVAGGMPESPLQPIGLKLNPPSDGNRLIVGLVDTAIQPMGSDLDKFFLKQVSIAGAAALDPSTPSHGTSMAQTVLRSLEAATKGTTSVQILPVDVYGSSQLANTWNVTAGIVEAYNQGARIINLSLGSYGDSTVLRDIIKEMSARGVMVVGAAGNEPVANAFFPAAYPEVLAVSAGTPGGFASYANYGGFVDVAAPDASIVHYGGRYWQVRGTSSAAAYTTGLAAGLAETTKMSWTGVRSVLMNTMPAPTGK